MGHRVPLGRLLWQPKPPPPQAVSCVPKMVRGSDAKRQHGAVFNVLHQQVVDAGASAGGPPQHPRVNPRPETEGYA